MADSHVLLVVDDEPDVVKSVKDLFRLDYRVLGAASAAEALELMKKEPAHVVLTDQRMQGMSGVEFLGKLKDESPETIRLLFTGYADIRAVIGSINEGHVYRYITKPWDTGEFQSIVRDAFGYYDLLQERKRLLLELQQSNNQLSESNKLKSAFIQVAGHELRTPLAILMGFSKLATLEPSPPGPLRDYIQGIDKSTLRLERLVTQILTMLSAEKFEAILDRKPEELAPLFRQAAMDILPFVLLRNLSLQSDIPDDLGTMEIDAEKIRDCVNQLLLNAVKFTPDGGSIRMSVQRNDQGLQIRVADSGSGIAQADLPRIFEPFFTGFDVSKHSSGLFEHQRRGLGLGLSIVKAFAQMHGGRIAVQSKPKEGATFEIFIPEPSVTNATNQVA